MSLPPDLGGCGLNGHSYLHRKTLKNGLKARTCSTTFRLREELGESIRRLGVSSLTRLCNTLYADLLHLKKVSCSTARVPSRDAMIGTLLACVNDSRHYARVACGILIKGRRRLDFIIHEVNNLRTPKGGHRPILS